MLKDNNDNNNDKNSNPVTIIVKRIAKKDKIKEFEEWLSGISKEVSRQQGSMGIDVIRPIDNNQSKPEYVIIFRFNNYDNLIKWEESLIRNEWLQKGKELVEGHADVQKQTGLEFWFTPYFKDKSSSHLLSPSSPPRYKMVIVTTIVISILLSTLVPQINTLTEMLSIPFQLRFVIGIAITVTLMTYLIMPLLTKLLKPWLFRS